MNLATLHPLAVERIYPLLQHDRQAVRKRVIQVCFKPMTAIVYYKISGNTKAISINFQSDSIRTTYESDFVYTRRKVISRITENDVTSPEFKFSIPITRNITFILIF